MGKERNVYAHFPPFGKEEEKERPPAKPQKAKRKRVKQTLHDIIHSVPLEDMTKEEQEAWLEAEELYLDGRC